MLELTDSVAFLAWLKLSMYMAIVSVAIVLSFHLKSTPSSLGKFRQSSRLVRGKLTQRRKEFRAAVGHCFLLSCSGVFDCWAGQLHQHNFKLQPSRGISTERLEDTDGFCNCLSFDHCDLHTVPCYECREEVDNSVMLVYFVDTARLLSQRAKCHVILPLYSGDTYGKRSPSKPLRSLYSASRIAQVESSTVV